MPKRKLQRFAENETFPHFFQIPYDELNKGFEYRGRWKDFFHNQNPIVLELGCGKGEFTVGLAEKYPQKNFIGIDIKGARIWRGAKTSFENQMPNVAFIRTRVNLVEKFFAPGEVNEIWITFPDPQPNKPRSKKRLTSPVFINHYRKVATPDAIVHLKTDSSLFFDFTLEVINELKLPLLFHTRDVDQFTGQEDAAAIRTFYEEKFRAEGIPIKYLRFKLKES